MKVQAVRGTINATIVQTTVGALWRKVAAQIENLRGNTSSQVIQMRKLLEQVLEKITTAINQHAPATSTTWEQKLAWADTMPASYEQGGNVLQDIGEWFNRVNPLFVAARAAFLGLVAGNFNGLADKMVAKGPEKVRSKWEGFGGDWGKLQEAIAKGAGTAQGIGFTPLLFPVLDSLAQGGRLPPEGVPSDTGRTGGGSLAGLWKIAKPVIEPLLSLLGINPRDIEPTPQQVADTPPTGGKPGTLDGKTLLLVGGIGLGVLLLTARKSR
jgi:hypothetical protein